MDLLKRFIESFGGEEKQIRYFFAPGRVNIIGEHVDYNGGYVLPCAISLGTYALIRKRDDNVMRFASTNFEQVVEITEIKYEKQHGWVNYPKGILNYMKGEISGFDVLFSGNIPNGAGLSSSASVELVMAVALNDVFSLGCEMIELVKIARKNENEFCGVNCGIMDMFAVGMGKKDFAMYLHCDSLEFEYVPLRLNEYKIVIMDTNKRRKLNESKYNERRDECEKAFACFSKKLEIENLSSISPGTYDAYEWLIEDTVIKKRAKHVIFENNRVKKAVEFLKSGNINALGELITASHISLRDDYEVSCKELDTIVDLALKTNGCTGARMTGAGFGGCAIALVKNENIPDFINSVSAGYEEIIGYAPTMYVQESGDGAKEIISF